MNPGLPPRVALVYGLKARRSTWLSYGPSKNPLYVYANLSLTNCLGYMEKKCLTDALKLIIIVPDFMLAGGRWLITYGWEEEN